MKIISANNDRNFDEIYDRNNNSFNILRFILASLVIYTHIYPLLEGTTSSGDYFVKITNGQLDGGMIAVYSFFVISGFLITQSMQNSNYISFIVKRILRIFPAFLISLILTAFILGPLVTNLSISEYFSFKAMDSPYNFILKNIFFNINGYSWTIRDVFSNNPFSGGINGSMWTLKHEFGCYIILLLMSFFGFIKHKKLTFLTMIAFLVLVLLNYKTGYQLFHLSGYKWWVLGDNEYIAFIKLAFYFLSGSVIYLFRDKLYFHSRFLILSLFIIIVATWAGQLKYALLLCLPYIIISFGIAYKIESFTKYGDFSYGIYIYAFPIQQTVILLMGQKISLFSFFIISYSFTLAISIISWFYVEKPVIDLKKNILTKF